jgi:spoIIIJ-associated protein
VEWVETTGRTVAEAKEAALDELGVDETDAEFEVLEEPRTGLFGRLKVEARVRARVRPTAPRQKVDPRRDRRRRRGRDDRPRGSDDGPRTDRPRRARNEGSQGSAPVAAPAAGANDDDEDEESAMEASTVPASEQAEMAREFVAGLIDAFGFTSDVTASVVDDDTVEVAVTGGDLGILVGPKGQTLAALQEITRTVVQRQVPGRTARLHVDVAGYREKRRVALERFTQQVATTVLETGTRKALEPMGAADRKVVHDTVNTIEGVSTTSEGEDPNRRVVILPDRAPDAAE